MTVKYNHTAVEKKWQEEWKKKDIYKTPARGIKKKYVLDMFPYPSGATMHVGHLEGYVGTDILSRYYRMQGFSVLHPMGWDAFGLPAENYAIKTGIHPDKSTHANIDIFRRQLVNSGMSYDWEMEIDTSSPEFYKWTQWIFIQMFKAGLAYKKKAPVNWCPKDETVLANEQVVDGKCERCDTPVIQKELDQWFLKITDYADRLISGLDGIDWLPEVKRQQINWIGKDRGLDVNYKVEGTDLEITVWTKFWETVFGTTFLVLAPEHEIIGKLRISGTNKKEVNEYVKRSLSKSFEERKETKEKTGIFTGLYAINQVNGDRVPIWVADYVLADVGTGAIMGVPAHDERDFEFAEKYDLRVVQVVTYKDKDVDKKVARGEMSFEGEGKLVNSAQFDGMDAWGEGKEKMADWMIKKGFAKWRTTYHLRDWLISRQRYWGCPIPMVHCKEHGWQPVDEKDLPILLPTDVDFLPHGESPIARSKSFQKDVVCSTCGKTAKREVDTMDTYVDSSWYFIRFVDPKNEKEFAGKKAVKDWLPVDDYVGGGHVVQHLLFARFFWKFLYDSGYIENSSGGGKSLGDEPFLKLRAPGWILGSDSRKMSKRWGNVVTPDDIIPKFGADTLRLYEMFMGPFDVAKPWSMTGVEGASRFLGRVWRLYQDFGDVVLTDEKDSREVLVKLHQTIKKVTEDIEGYKFNTAISAMMELVNLLYGKAGGVASRAISARKIRCAEWDEALRSLCLLLSPFAPHLSEEVWVKVLDQPFSVHAASWPRYNADLIRAKEIMVVIQVNGKVRSQLTVESSQSKSEDDVVKLAKKDENTVKWLYGRKIKKTVFVPGKLVNFVV